MQNQTTKKRNANIDETKLHDTKNISSRVTTKIIKFEILDNKLNFTKQKRDQRLTHICYEKNVAIEVLQFNATHYKNIKNIH